MENSEIKNETILSMVEEISGKKNLKDPYVLNAHAEITDETIYERVGFRPLAKNIIDFLKGVDRVHPWVIGHKGTGKTAIIKYITKIAASVPDYDFEQVYLNCRNINNCYNVMKALLNEKKRMGKIDMIYYFLDRYKDMGKKRIIILDETDCLEDDSLLYYMGRNPELNNNLLLLVSQTEKYYERVKADVKSSLRYEVINFKRYGCEDIREILKKRANVGLKSYDKYVLDKIALAVEMRASADIRIALNVMREIFKEEDHPKSTYNPERKRYIVSKEVLKRIDNMVDNEKMKFLENTIGFMSDTRIIFIYYALKYGKSTVIYEKIRKNFLPTLARSHFYKLMGEVANLGFFVPMTIRQGKVNMIVYQPLVDQIIVDMIKEDIERRAIQLPE